MIYEENLTEEQNDFIDALEDDIDNPDVRLQRMFEALAEEEINDPRILMAFD